MVTIMHVQEALEVGLQIANNAYELASRAADNAKFDMKAALEEVCACVCVRVCMRVGIDVAIHVCVCVHKPKLTHVGVSTCMYLYAQPSFTRSFTQTLYRTSVVQRR